MIFRLKTLFAILILSLSSASAETIGRNLPSLNGSAELAQEEISELEEFLASSSRNGRVESATVVAWIDEDAKEPEIEAARKKADSLTRFFQKKRIPVTSAVFSSSELEGATLLLEIVD